MRDWIFKALIFATLCTAPLWAQRGGGGGHGFGGGGHGFSGGGHPGGASGFHGSPGFSGGHGWNGGGWHGNGGGFHGGGFHGGFRGHGFRFRNRGYPWWGWGYGYPLGYGFYDYPDYGDYYPSDEYSGAGYPPTYDSGYAYPPPPSGSTTSYASEGEVQQIQNEVTQLRAQQAQRYAEPSHPATVLVYRDGHTETVENYAVADSTLWVLNKDRARKIPLSELNVPATKRDNDERGVDFEVPDSR